MSKKTPKKQSAKEEKPGKKKESAWEFTRSMVILIGAVLLIKFFVCDIFFIPTGSMEQTLHGHPDNGDRILCTKLNYLWRNPERWEVFVFKFPYEQTPEGDNSSYKGEYFIKRCVGLPGESLALIGGDVFVLPSEYINQPAVAEKAERAVKPDHIQRTLWLPVYNEDFKDLSLEEFQYYWQLPKTAASSLSISGSRLNIDAGNNPMTITFKPHTRFGSLSGIPDRYVRRQVVEFACPVIGCKGRVRKTVTSPKMTARCPICGEYLQESDVISYDFRTGYPSNYQSSFEKVSKVAVPQYRGEWWHFVPDLSLTTGVTLKDSKSSILYTIIVDNTTYNARLTATNLELTKGEEKLQDIPLALTPEKQADFQFYHLDGQLRAYLNGKELCDITVDPTHLSSAITNPQKTDVALTFSGGVTLDNIDIKRDIFYYNYRDSRGFFRLPADGYMALGDNCPSSNDSRFWGPVPQANLTGTAQFVWWPLHAIKMLH